MEAVKIFLSRYSKSVREVGKLKNKSYQELELLYRKIFGGAQFHNTTSYKQDLTKLQFSLQSETRNREYYFQRVSGGFRQEYPSNTDFFQISERLLVFLS